MLLRLRIRFDRKHYKTKFAKAHFGKPSYSKLFLILLWNGFHLLWSSKYSFAQKCLAQVGRLKIYLIFHE